MVYHFRRSALDDPSTYTLEEDALIIESKIKKEIPYEKIDSIRLRYNPTRINPNLFECIIENKIGKIKLNNMNYKAPYDFDDNSKEYNEFIIQLHNKLQKYEKIKFYTGVSWGMYIFYVILTLFTLWLLSSVLISMGASSTLIFIKFLFFGFLLYLGIKYFIKNKPQKYKADQIPDKLLPK